MSCTLALVAWTADVLQQSAVLWDKVTLLFSCHSQLQHDFVFSLLQFENLPDYLRDNE